jgi:hypothetical protein
MNRKLFEQLVKSVRQAGDIALGKRKPSRRRVVLTAPI